jgi:hypothetical protein
MTSNSLSLRRIGSIEAEIHHYEQRNARLRRIIFCRQCSAPWCSCIASVCLLPPTLVGVVLCYPCICYRLLHHNENVCAQIMQICCRSFDGKPPEDCCELGCRMCTPLFCADLPNSWEGYALPPERQEMVANVNYIDRSVRQILPALFFKHLKSINIVHIVLDYLRRDKNYYVLREQMRSFVGVRPFTKV